MNVSFKKTGILRHSRNIMIMFITIFTLIATTAFPGAVVLGAGDTTLYFSYTVNGDGNAVITGFNDNATDAVKKNPVIPEKVDGYTVVEVGGFQDNTTIETVTLPATLQTLTKYAFKNCTTVKSVTMPSCETINLEAFYGCKVLSTINSDYPGEVVLPENLTYLGKQAFRTANAIETVFLPDSLTTLGVCMFYRSSSIRNIYFPDEIPNKENLKNLVGGFQNFETINVYGSSDSYIAQYSQSDEAVDNWTGDTYVKSGNRLYNFIAEESDIIIYNEEYVDGDGVRLKGTVKDAGNETRTAGFKARVFNTGDTAKELTAFISMTGESGKLLKGVGMRKIQIPAYSGITLSSGDLKVENVDFAAGDIIKVFFWDTQENIKPVVTRKFTFSMDGNEIYVMAVGNSFAMDSVTYLKKIAEADGIEITSYNCYVGGRPLTDHYSALINNSADYEIQPEGKRSTEFASITDMAAKYKWDYIMLQGTTHGWSWDEALWGENETPSADIWQTFADTIGDIAPQAKRLVHATWAPYELIAANVNSGKFTGGTPDSRGAYTKAALERYQLGANIYSTEKTSDGDGVFIPTAVAVDYLIRNYGFPEYEGEADADGKYSNEADTRGVYRDKTCHLTDNVGRVLAGLVWYEMITGNPATENKYARSTLSDKDMAMIKEAAHYACQNYRTYEPQPAVNAPETDNSGLSFSADKKYSMANPLTELPVTYEATVCVQSNATRPGVIFGSYIDNYTDGVNFEIHNNKNPRLYIRDNNLKVTEYIFTEIEIAADEWTHIAIVCDREGGKVHCYINGVLKQSMNMKTAHPSELDISNASCLGGDLRSGNTQYFKGRIKNVAIYSDVRTAEEIASDCLNSSISTDNLIAGYDLSEYISSNIPTTIYDLGQNGYNLDYTGDEWLEDAPVTSDYAYSFAIIGDTQEINYRYSDEFSGMYDWIAENADAHKIKWVFGLGDITENGTEAEWERAKANIQKLDGIVPYSLNRGNHDSTSKLNTYFSYPEYTGRVGGYWTENTYMQNTYHTFSVGDVNYLVLCINYGAEDGILSWAGKIIEKYPQHNVILTTHAFLDSDGTTLDDTNSLAPTVLSKAANDGDDIWEKLVKKYENIVLVMSGHIPSDKVVVAQTSGENGNTVTQMLVDPEDTDLEKKGAGMIAMMYFSADGKYADVRYYSTVNDAYYMRENQFSLELDMMETTK